jgi:hypothetical protein
MTLTLFSDIFVLAQDCSDNCIPGMYLNQSQCTFCPTGKTSVSYVSPTCTNCAAGKYSTYGDIQCSDCPKGSFNQAVGQSICSLCPQGKYSNTTGVLECTPCPGSLTTISEGSMYIDSCTDCVQGYIMTSNGCTSCPSGKYWNNGTSCLSCSPGYYSDQMASLKCLACPPQTWNPDQESNSSLSCRACPQVPGAVCPSNSSIPFIRSGWYRNWEIGVDSVLSCFPEEACLESGFRNTTCSVGYTGVACTDCSENFFRLGLRCRQCIGEAIRWIIISVGLVLLVGICWKLTQVKGRLPFLWRIIFQWIQFLGLYGQLSDKWPSSLRALFNFTNFFNFELQFFGFSCNKQWTFTAVWLMKMFLPLLFFAVSLTCFVLRFKPRTKGELKSLVFSKTPLILHSLNFFSTILISSSFEIFNCVPQTDGTFLMNSDPSHLCYDSGWKKLLAADMAFTSMYIILPIMFGIAVSIRICKGISKPNPHLQIFYDPYRQGCEFWELIKVLDKIVFVFIRDVATVDRAHKNLMLLSVLTVGNFLEIHFRPYRSEIVSKTSMT